MKTINELHKIREEKRKELDLRINTKADTREKHILVCQGTGCTSSKSPKILESFKKIIKENNIENVRVIKTGCFVTFRFFKKVIHNWEKYLYCLLAYINYI